MSVFLSVKTMNVWNFLAVTTFTDETEALSAVVKNPESFHIAIVEVNTSVENESFKFLEAAKDVLPTISL